MRAFRILAISASLSILSASGLLMLAGCDDSPSPGFTASSVDKEEAARLNQALDDFSKRSHGGDLRRIRHEN